jgi:tRNA pseudouridine38-40 synthase
MLRQSLRLLGGLERDFAVSHRQHFYRTSPVRTLPAVMENLADLNSIDVVEKEESSEPERPEYPWKRAKKMAAMLSFSGKKYYGMQRNPGDEINTIEDELMAALAKSGAIDPTWEKVPQKAFFTRASRTDKGVSAARMTVSLKMLGDADLVPAINSFLPDDIRLQALVRVTKNFNCQSQADARTYLYLLPTFAFSPCEELVSEAWRCGPDTVAEMNKVLKHYVGSHYFHNYTSSKLPMEPSSRRFIQEFEAGPPFMREGLEWSVIRVKGQSFMLHQIRKMVGLAVSIVRGHTGLSTLETAWGHQRIDIPRAPGLGLLLDTIHYDK